MGNLCWAIPRSLLPGREAMPIPEPPNGAVTPLHSLVAMAWNLEG